MPEDIGEFRHKQVTNQDERFVTKINRDIADLEEHQVGGKERVNQSIIFFSSSFLEGLMIHLDLLFSVIVRHLLGK